MKQSAKVFPGGVRQLILYLTFIGSFAPLSTDLYLPAMPDMAVQFHTGPDVMAYTLSGFLFSFALSMLVWGPFSDKYGRRPVLLIGTVLYMASTSMLALTDSLAMLIGLRCLQGAGSGALSAISLAIVKDIFRGPLMAKVITVIQAMHVLAPMLAPVLGGGLLLFVSWRGIFASQLVCGAAAFAGAFLLRETLPKATEGPALSVLLRIPAVLSHRAFRHMLLLFSAAVMPFFAYLGTSAFIYQQEFGVSAQAYSLFFAANAGITMVGPIGYMMVFNRWNEKRLISGVFALILLSGLWLCCAGGMCAWSYFAAYLCISFVGSVLRAPSTVLMMNCLKTDTGTVSALIGCCGLLFGSLAMTLASLPVWRDYIISDAVICTLIGFLGSLYWLWMCRTGLYTEKQDNA